jgi:type II secretory pathway pseudopilin PulG
MRPGDPARRRERGFTYLGLLLLVAAIGLLLARTGELAATAAQRERETQLLWVGHEYRDAIGRYWSQKRAYPQSLQDLLGSGPDSPVQLRYLRRLYPDPMTNAVDWVLLPAPKGGILGVASSSKRAPLKTGNFDKADKDFQDAKSYGDWQFTFPPAALASLPGAPFTPGVIPPTPGTVPPTPGAVPSTPATVPFRPGALPGRSP